MKQSVRLFLLSFSLFLAGLLLVACGHEHTFSAQWQSDETQHWQEASCDHMDAVKYEPHVFDGGSIVGNNFYYTCTVCSYWYKDDVQTALFAKGTEALLETANAYLNKNGLIEYDQFNGRRQTNATPEEATEQSYLFLDCSSYVASVYYNALGIRVMPSSYGSQNTKNYTKYAKENLGKNADVIGYYETLDYTTADAQDAVIAELKRTLLPGDIIVYRRGAKGLGEGYDEASLSGHAILYMGNDRFSHSTGTSYNDGSTEQKLQYRNDPEQGADRATGQEYSNGSVLWLRASDVLNRGSGSRMLFGEKSSNVYIYNFSVLRPMLSEGGVPAVTEQAEKRLALSGISFEKTVDKGLYSTVCIGDTITYTLKLSNSSSTRYDALAFTDILPTGVTFVESSIPMTVEGNTLRASIMLYAHQTKEVTWTVRVESGVLPGTELCGKTEVGGLRMKDTPSFVSRYSHETLALIVKKARECTENGQTFEDPLDFVSLVYADILSENPFEGKTALEVLSSVFEVKSETKATLNAQSAYASMVANNLYGGSRLSSDYTANNSLVRTVRESSLSAGDVILCEWYGKVRVYIYLGDGELAMVDSVTNTCEVKENGSEEWVKEGSNYYQSHLLASLFAYRMYAVLRP